MIIKEFQKSDKNSLIYMIFIIKIFELNINLSDI